MLPYVVIDPHRTGGIQPFGFFVVLAMMVGELLMRRRARKVGLVDREMRTLFWWCLLGGLFVSHVLDTIFYHPSELTTRPWSLLLVWEGLSSMGGFIGAAVAALFWKHWEPSGRSPLPTRRGTPAPLLPYAEVVFATFPVAWTVARLGCAVVHDHPGVRTSAATWFSVAYPDGARGVIQHVAGPISLVWGPSVRHDLGLLEALLSLVIAALAAALWSKKVPLGTYAALVSLTYAPGRFALDLLRMNGPDGDLRYGSLTFAQWCCIGLGLFGLAMARYAFLGSEPRPSARSMQPRITDASSSTSGGSSIDR